jgi:rhodanese-related sulfurtransferase
MDPLTINIKRQEENTIVLDIRSYESFGGQHIPGAFNIDFGGNFAVFAGWILPQNSNILLVSDKKEQIHEAMIWLRRVGLDCITGYLEGGMFEWAKAGLPTAHISQLSIA